MPHARPLRLAKALSRKGVRGGTLLLRTAERLGMLDRPVRYQLSRGITLDVPLSWRPWDLTDILRYEVRLVDAFAATGMAGPVPVDFLDCGADIGLISVRVAGACPRLERLVAFEPSDEAWAFLHTNLSRLPLRAEALRVGVSDFRGSGELVSPSHDPESNMARYVAPVADGAGGFPVIRIDDLGLERGGTVLMKLDVEGGEGPIVRGAVETLADAACFAVSVEHHPQQVDRVGVDTVETLRLVNEIRPCHFRIVERPEMTVDLDRKLGPQLGETGVFNVFCRSVER